MRNLSHPLRTAIASAVAVMGMLSILPAANAEPTSVQDRSGANLESITVEDSAGVLNEARLRSALEEIDFNEPTQVAVYTRTGAYADNINTETLLYAQQSHPEWISQDAEDYGDYWADGYFIITLSVEGSASGQIGTYFGEDRKVSSSQMETIHGAGTQDFRQGRWSDGVIAVATEGARLMNRPWYKQPGLWWTAGLGAGGGIITWVSIVAVRSNRRKKFAEQLQAGTSHLTNVTMDLDTTELAARTLPTGSYHAADLERRFTDFVANYRKNFSEQKELEAASKKERSSAVSVVRVKEFRLATEELDMTDDAIIAASALYTRSPMWEDAWRSQAAPILEDLDELAELIDKTKEEDSMEAAAAALDSFSHSARSEVETIGTQLKAQEIDVDAALDRLLEVRKALTAKLEEFSTAQIEAYTETKDEKEEMRKAIQRSRDSWSKNNPRGGGSILDVTHAGNVFWRVQAYNVGYSSGVNAVTSSREAASSSSGVSHGYSGGGGSFSGAGGSSRF